MKLLSFNKTEILQLKTKLLPDKLATLASVTKFFSLMTQN